MNSTEQREIAALPERYRPLGAWSYFGWMIVYNLPIVGLIFLIVNACGAFGGRNVNCRSFARSYFCVYVIFFVIVIIAASTGLLAVLIDALSKT